MTDLSAPEAPKIAEPTREQQRAARLVKAFNWIAEHDAWQHVQAIDAWWSPVRINVNGLSSLRAMFPGMTVSVEDSASYESLYLTTDDLVFWCTETKPATEAPTTERVL